MRKPLVPGPIGVSMVAVGLIAFTVVKALAQSNTSTIGQPITEADLAAWDISIAPDGATLPPGSGTVAQGRAVYETQCSACHGADGRDGPAGALVGGLGTLTSQTPVKTIGSFWPYATTVFDYVRRAMPYFAPGSLTNDEVYALTAFLLHRNGLLVENDTLDADGLRAVTMPNVDGFIAHYPPVN